MKTIFLTGATGRLGRHMLYALLDKNYRVIFTARNENKVAEVLAKTPHQQNATPLYLDLQQPDALSMLLDQLKEQSIMIDCLINNARYLPDEAETVLDTRTKWMNEYALNVVFPYELSHALSITQESNLKNIINISSIYGMVAVNPNLYLPHETQSPLRYGVSKAALLHLTKEMAVRYAPDIRVNALSLGGVSGRASEHFQERYGKLCPQNRMVDMSEVTSALLFLVSDQSKGMTGQNIVLDGGWTAW